MKSKIYSSIYIQYFPSLLWLYRIDYSLIKIIPYSTHYFCDYDLICIPWAIMSLRKHEPWEYRTTIKSECGYESQPNLQPNFLGIRVFVYVSSISNQIYYARPIYENRQRSMVAKTEMNKITPCVISKYMSEHDYWRLQTCSNSMISRIYCKSIGFNRALNVIEVFAGIRLLS